MLAAAAIGPRTSPASTTTSGWSVSGTGVPGSGIATCDASASATAKPTTPSARTRALEVDRARSAPADVVIEVMSDALHGKGHRVPATEAERRQAGRLVAILQGIQQRREDACAARAQRVAERDRAAVDV